MAGNTSTKLPQDSDSAPIQVLAPVEATVVGFVLSSSTNKQSLPAGSEIVEVACTGNCKFAFGISSVDATAGTARVITTGVYTYKVPVVANVLAAFFDAVTVDGSTGRITVTRMV